jgi:SAM-dependent methyltransferase
MPAGVKSFVRTQALPAVLRAMSAKPARAHDFAPGPCRICGDLSLSLYAFDGVRQYAAYKDIFAALFTCAACGHKQFLPDLTDETLADVYARGYWATESEPDIYAEYYRAKSNPTADDILAALVARGMRPPFRLHEFGCGTGLSVHHLRKRGVDATGSDWSPVAIGFGHAQGNTHIFPENANTLSQMSGVALDAVFTNHVIEHLPDPVGFLRNLAPLMSPDSLIVMRLPNGDGALDRALGMLWDPLFYFPHHIHYFSPRSIAIAAQRAGLKVLEVTATERAVPQLLDAAQGASGDFGARLSAAAAAYETEEVQVVFAPASSPRTPGESVARALARAPVPAREGARARWCNVEDHYERGTPWRAQFQIPGEAAPPGDMAYDSASNQYYFNGAGIADHWLQVAPEGPLPVLAFRAPAAGRYRLQLDMAARFIGGHPVDLIVGAAGREPLLRQRLVSPAPEHVSLEVTLAAGESLHFRAEAVGGMQRAILVARVDPA